MCCVFIDFEKASDIVWREGLWCALLMNHINGKIHIVMINMYHNVKSRVMYNNEFSEYFTCGNGVLDPFLFSLYVTDLEIFFRKE
jgi:hypothetical protein